MKVPPRLISLLKKIGNIQSRVILTAVYWILLFPIGILVRVFSDSLAAKPKDKTRHSYWVIKQISPGDIEKWRRQY